MTQLQNLPRVIFLAVFALMFLGVAAWNLVQGNPVEAAGQCLVATLAVLAAVLISNPDRPRRTQRRIFIASMTLVPITLAVFITSIFI